MFPILPFSEFGFVTMLSFSTGVFWRLGGDVGLPFWFLHFRIMAYQLRSLSWSLDEAPGYHFGVLTRGDVGMSSELDTSGTSWRFCG